MSVVHSVNFFEAHLEPTWSYKDLQITQKLTRIKHLDLLQAKSVFNLNYKIKKSIGIHVFVEAT